RYIGFSIHTPSLNMSIDQSLFDGAPEHGPAGVLRFFSFSTVCISIGKNQKVDDLPGDLRGTGIEIVRRPTGGGAVLHDGDLCYSIVMPETCLGTTGSLMESYRLITGGLKRGFGLLGIDLEYGEGSRYRGGPMCFAGALGYELSLGGRKIVGGAQRRAKGMLLQQGSIMPYHHVPHERLIAALLEGLGASLDVDYTPLPLTEGELEQAGRRTMEFSVSLRHGYSR
ncbi:MAG: lipoate--protein ligase family protein, partial [Deltaproteobacteria bacterium]|nr:lipoate--protein ligase family protein [Deltaproteobacteria bacterium]